MKSRVEETVRVSAGKVQRTSDDLPRKWPCQQVTRQMTFLTNRLWAPEFSANCTHLGWAKQTDAVQRGHSLVPSTSPLCYAGLAQPSDPQAVGLSMTQQPVQMFVPSLRDTCKHSLMPNYFKILYFHNGSQHKLLAHSANVQATNACSAAEGHTLVSCLKSE